MTRKHSIIIGGTKGVGRELAVLFATAGQHVTAVGRAPGEFPQVSGGTIEGFAGTAEEPEALLSALTRQIAKRGTISSLVFLQRYRGNGDAWTGELTVSLTATKVLLEGLTAHFDEHAERSVCIVSSNASSFIARNQSVAYHATKAAITQMARFYAVKLGKLGIRVNVVSPCTFVKQESASFFAEQPELQSLYARITPLCRMGTAREVAMAVAFLCGPDASFITGQDLTVDGGLSLVMQDTLAREVAGFDG
jgi:NAD(P)-dependent dehydrogenase (short-subunit alcohol dehydrogenase family)